MVTHPEVALYCQAELPRIDIQDEKLMKIQEDHIAFTSPEAHVKVLPRITSLARGEFIQQTKIDGHFKFNGPMMDGLELLNWNQLYNFAEKPTKKNRKK